MYVATRWSIVVVIISCVHNVVWCFVVVVMVCLGTQTEITQCR